MAETKKDALVAFDAFIETWGVKYAKAVECLTRDRDALLACYDFPATPALAAKCPRPTTRPAPLLPLERRLLEQRLRH
jgi:hypothetical protein